MLNLYDNNKITWREKWKRRKIPCSEPVKTHSASTFNSFKDFFRTSNVVRSKFAVKFEILCPEWSGMKNIKRAKFRLL